MRTPTLYGYLTAHGDACKGCRESARTARAMCQATGSVEVTNDDGRGHIVSVWNASARRASMERHPAGKRLPYRAAPSPKPGRRRAV